jgi:hypothetical protein
LGTLIHDNNKRITGKKANIKKSGLIIEYLYLIHALLMHYPCFIYALSMLYPRTCQPVTTDLGQTGLLIYQAVE